MINHLSIIRELGPNATLLLESDTWLDNERKRLASELAKTSSEFDSILRAIKYKRSIQQSNNVAVRLIERDEYGHAIDITLSIMPITEALKLLQNTTALDTANDLAQRNIWTIDGYDVQTAEQLAKVS